MSVSSSGVSWATIATGASALATMGMIFYTARMAGATSRSAKATESAIELERKTLEQSRDALLPMLSLEPNFIGQTITPFEKFGDLVIKNDGVGPAIIRHVTFRDELNPAEIYQASERHAVLGPNGQLSLPLKAAADFTVTETTEDAISSVSIWYEDVYGRAYRSRLVFQYTHKKTTEGTRPLAVLSLAQEFTHEAVVPHLSYGLEPFMTDQFASWLEGGIRIPATGVDLPLLRLDTVPRITSELFPAHCATHNKPYYVRGWGFWLHSRYPQLTLEIPGHPRFVLIRTETENSSDNQMSVVQESYFEACKGFGQISPPSDWDKDLDKLGLKDRHDAQALLDNLYQDTIRFVLQRLTRSSGRAPSDPSKGACKP